MTKRWVIASIVIALLAVVLFAHGGTVTKGLIGKNDLSLWYSGDSSQSFTRSTSTGYSLTLQKLDWVGIDVCQVYGGGVNRTRSVLVSALSNVGSENVQFWLSPGTWAINDDLTIPSNVTLVIPPGALLSPDAGVTLTIYSPENISAGTRQQIFDLTNNSNPIAFSKNGTIYPDWWGAKGDDSTDSTSAINAAIQAGFNSTVQLNGGIYLYSSSILIQRTGEIPAIKIRGVHKGVLARTDLGGTILKAAAGFTGDVAIAIGESGGAPRDVILENFSLVGPGDTDAGSIGIQIRGASDIFTARDLSIDEFETGVVIGRLDSNEGGNSRNFFWNVEFNDVVTVIKNLTTQGFITNLYGCSFGTRTQYGVVSYRDDGGEGNVVQMFGGEVGSWDIIFDFRTTYGKAIISGVHFESDPNGKTDPPTIIKTQSSQNGIAGSVLFEGNIFNYGSSNFLNSTKAIVEYYVGSNLTFSGNRFNHQNAIVTISGGGAEGQTVVFEGNSWEYAPDIPKGTEVILRDEHYINQNKKRSGGQTVAYAASISKMAHIQYAYQNRRRMYASSAPSAGSAYWWSAGSIVWNTSASAGGSPGWVCTTPGKTGTLTVSMTASSTTVTISGGNVWTMAGWELNDEILIPGAGAAGADLTTTITAIDVAAATFTVADAASTTVSGVTATHGSESAVFKAMANLAP